MNFDLNISLSFFSYTKQEVDIEIEVEGNWIIISKDAKMPNRIHTKKFCVCDRESLLLHT